MAEPKLKHNLNVSRRGYQRYRLSRPLGCLRSVYTYGDLKLPFGLYRSSVANLRASLSSIHIENNKYYQHHLDKAWRKSRVPEERK